MHVTRLSTPPCLACMQLTQAQSVTDGSLYGSAGEKHFRKVAKEQVHTTLEVYYNDKSLRSLYNRKQFSQRAFRPARWLRNKRPE